MTNVSLEELLTVPEHPAAEYGERYGYREDTVNGRRVYVTRNEKDRAVVGPKRHRGRWFGLSRKRPKVNEEQKLERIITFGDVQAHHSATLAKAIGGISEALRTAEIPTIRFAIPATPPTPQEKPNVFRSIGNWFTERFYDEEWHAGAQRTAFTVLAWVFVLAFTAVAIKGAIWTWSM